MIATGSRPELPPFDGVELGITSDGVFDLKTFPRKLVIGGAGYIAMEFAGLFAALGSDVTVVCRGSNVLRGFDEDVRQAVTPLASILKKQTPHSTSPAAVALALSETKEWLDLFGPFDRPYVDDYKPVPFSRKYVRHIAGWYAQKHPDEDFAESFAVWLTPDSDWKRRYARLPGRQTR